MKIAVFQILVKKFNQKPNPNTQGNSRLFPETVDTTDGGSKKSRENKRTTNINENENITMGDNMAKNVKRWEIAKKLSNAKVYGSIFFRRQSKVYQRLYETIFKRISRSFHLSGWNK